MKRKNAGIAMAPLVALLGCVYTPDPTIVSKAQKLVGLPCNPEAFAAYEGEGTGVLEGQAFLKTRGGDVKLGAGNEVIVVPAVDCGVHWWGMAGLDEVYQDILPRDATFQRFVRRTTSDGQAEFRFDGLPPGDYYVRTHVTWEVYNMPTQGGLVGRRVTVLGDRSTSVILTE